MLYVEYNEQNLSDFSQNCKNFQEVVGNKPKVTAGNSKFLQTCAKIHIISSVLKNQSTSKQTVQTLSGLLPFYIL